MRRTRTRIIGAGVALVVGAALSVVGIGAGVAGATKMATTKTDFGPACGSVPKSGSGSFKGMTKADVASAASHNPVLSTLVTAVQKANLVTTLNNAKRITVFAPDNSAFAKVPKNTLDSLLATTTALTKVLEYHVVGKELTPAQLDGKHTTLEGGTLSVSGRGSSFKVNGSAAVVCGNVKTANAVVYIINSVLSPPSTSTNSVDFGAGCSAVPTSGAGSFSGMTQTPVATAASNNPVLSTLVTAVKAAGLVTTLNNAKTLTVFAPDNTAFSAVPSSTLQALLATTAALTKVLEYHVVPGKLSPSQLAGTHKTLEGSTLKVTGSGTSFTVNGTSQIVCGNVQTSNATVYIISAVLTPPSS